MDTKDVPHGAVSEVPYHSKALDRVRRMHVYTPPGYERGEGTFPVLYLLHGAGDSDDAWTTLAALHSSSTILSPLVKPNR